MSFHPRAIPFTILVLLLTLCHLATPTEIYYNKLYVIRGTSPNGLVLDATNQSELTIQHFTGFRPQLWRFEPGSKPGSYYLVNDYWWKVLDYHRPSNWFLFVTDRDNSLNQQWIIDSSGKIINAATKKNVDIPERNFSPGVKVEIWENVENAVNQKFVLEEKS